MSVGATWLLMNWEYKDVLVVGVFMIIFTLSLRRLIKHFEEEGDGE